MLLVSPELRLAACEYRWLLDRGYAESSALKLVGDKHQLPRDERMILFRGVATSVDSSARAALVLPRTGDALTGAHIYADGYNQALTVMFYLLGRPLFVGTDGLTRDSGGSHGHIANEALFERAAGILVEEVSKRRPAAVDLYLDEPVSGSAAHAALFRKLFMMAGIETEVRLEKSADAPLKALVGAREASGERIVIATSDSGIVKTFVGSAVDRTTRTLGVFDAARAAIELAFGPIELLDLRLLLDGETGLVAQAEL
jgi:hypothetical protein